MTSVERIVAGDPTIIIAASVQITAEMMVIIERIVLVRARSPGPLLRNEGASGTEKANTASASTSAAVNLHLQ